MSDTVEVTPTSSPFTEFHRAIAQAVLDGDHVAAMAMRDILGEIETHSLTDGPAPPENMRFDCKVCRKRGEYAPPSASWYSYLASDADHDNLESLDGTITLYCWTCHIRNVRTVHSTHTVREAIMSAGVLTPSSVKPIDEKLIRVWRFEDAPVLLRMLSRFGGDEDWLAIVPPGVEVPSWMADGTPFGCSSVQYTNVGGWTLAIGAHS